MNYGGSRESLHRFAHEIMPTFSDEPAKVRTATGRAKCADRPRDDRERRQRKGHRQPRLEGDQAYRSGFCGDTLYAESEVLEKRESKLRPTQGIVTVHTRAFNQDGVSVMESVRSALISKRGTTWTTSTEKWNPLTKCEMKETANERTST